MELKSTQEYKGYTIKTFISEGKAIIKIFLGDDPIDYTIEMDQEYEGSVYSSEGSDAAKHHIDEREEKENSL